MNYSKWCDNGKVGFFEALIGFKRKGDHCNWNLYCRKCLGFRIKQGPQEFVVPKKMFSDVELDSSSPWVTGTSFCKLTLKCLASLCGEYPPLKVCSLLKYGLHSPVSLSKNPRLKKKKKISHWHLTHLKLQLQTAKGFCLRWASWATKCQAESMSFVIPSIYMHTGGQNIAPPGLWCSKQHNPTSVDTEQSTKLGCKCTKTSRRYCQDCVWSTHRRRPQSQGRARSLSRS